MLKRGNRKEMSGRKESVKRERHFKTKKTRYHIAVPKCDSSTYCCRNQENSRQFHITTKILCKTKKTSNLNTAGPLAPGLPRAPAAPGNP